MMVAPDATKFITKLIPYHRLQRHLMAVEIQYMRILRRPPKFRTKCTQLIDSCTNTEHFNDCVTSWRHCHCGNASIRHRSQFKNCASRFHGWMSFVFNPLCRLWV